MNTAYQAGKESPCLYTVNDSFNGTKNNQRGHFMYNTKFITVDGKDLYPGYLGREQRALIREQYRGKKEYMWCACRPDAGLYYKFSEDLKIYPEHNGYTHDRYCCRFKNQTGSEQQKPP